MRLINTHTYELEEHVKSPPYAILSHTWRDGEEVLFAEYAAREACRKAGYRKIDFLCKQARDDGLDYVWIDTCCIDKSSSSELSEAINSMYAWYKKAQMCYVYLEDVNSVVDIENCRWLTRGWTLQELIAPSDVRFYGNDWIFLGTKSTLLANLVQWTNIDQIVLEQSHAVQHMSVATRMSWAASRRTTRIEDMAYCLLGIFSINLPLIYGEREKAFVRLQEEILRQTPDVSLLAFDRSRLPYNVHKLFAQSPDIFLRHPKIITVHQTHCEVTSTGLVLNARIIRSKRILPFYLMTLGCRFEFDHSGEIAMFVMEREQEVENEFFYTAERTSLTVLSSEVFQNVRHRRILLMKGSVSDLSRSVDGPRRYTCYLRADELISHSYEVIHTVPELGLKSWSEKKLCSEIQTYNVPTVRRFAFVHWQHCEAFIISLAVIPWNIPFHDVTFMSAKAKPKRIDCKSWLVSEGVYTETKISDELLGDPLTMQYEIRVGDELWKRIGHDRRKVTGLLEPFEDLCLSSGKCFATISISIKESADNQWIIILQPGSHSCSKRPSDAKSTVRRSKRLKRDTPRI